MSSSGGLVGGAGWAAAGLDDLGEGPGFRKVRRALEVAHMGVNAVIVPPGIQSGEHFHDEQEEVYFVHAGELEFRFGDGSTYTAGPGAFVRVDAATVRGFANTGDVDAVYVCFGAKDGYVGRDAHLASGQRVGAISPLEEK